MFAVVFLVCVLAREGLAGAGGSAWKYGGKEAQGEWSKKFPDCRGLVQSPINIETKKVVYAPTIPPFDLSAYDSTDGVTMKLENLGGRTAEIVVGGNVIIRGGGLPGDYKLQQMHFHWGGDDTRGSEHSIDGKYFPLELHLVHSQVQLESMSAAASHPEGLAVLGILFELGDENPNYDLFLNSMDKIVKANSEAELEPFPISKLLPSSLDFYRYGGSLTTPPCLETVIWTVLGQRVVISDRQMKLFRSLYDENSKPLVDDYRPTQALNNRVILTNCKDLAAPA